MEFWKSWAASSRQLPTPSQECLIVALWSSGQDTPQATSWAVWVVSLTEWLSLRSRINKTTGTALAVQVVWPTQFKRSAFPDLLEGEQSPWRSRHSASSRRGDAWPAQLGSFGSWLSQYIPRIILLINNLVCIVFTIQTYRVSKYMACFQHIHRNNRQSTLKISGQREQQMHAKFWLKTRTVALPFSNSRRIGSSRAFQKTSSTSISVSCSCKLALEAAKESGEGKGIVKMDS